MKVMIEIDQEDVIQAIQDWIPNQQVIKDMQKDAPELDTIAVHWKGGSVNVKIVQNNNGLKV